MTKHRFLTALMAVLFVPALAAADSAQLFDRRAPESPGFVRGDFGTLARLDDAAALRASARDVLEGLLVREFRASGKERVVPGRIMTDELGAVHVRFSQEINGLKVAGAGLVLHAHADGTVFAVNGEFLRAEGLPVQPVLDAETALEFALGTAGIRGDLVSEPELTYVRADDGRGHLAWQATVEYVDAVGPQRDVVFASTETGRMVARNPLIRRALSIETYDCSQKSKGGCLLVSTSTQPISTGDLAVDSAHNYTIATYDYYWLNHNRDSIDDNGRTLISYVHYNNSNTVTGYNGGLAYGDGDGVTFAPLCEDADVVGHELTHGVTEYTSALVYSGESGALSESWSDIFGALVDRQAGATGADIWYVAEDVYTPLIQGDALRSMSDPAEFGDSDYYPDRYTGTADNGGVHTNAGISNLAFQLVVDGGTHPRGKTSVVVPSIGFEAAADAFYLANVACMTPGSDFEAARFCTALFAGANEDAVNAAWDAVGVPSGVTVTPLADGVPVTTSAGTGEEQHFSLDVSGASSVTFTTTGANGDADLYVRYGTPATTADYDCASTSSTSNEMCGFNNPSDGTWYVMVRAESAFTDLDVEGSTVGATCTPLGGSCNQNEECCPGLGCKGKPGTKTCK